MSRIDVALFKALIIFVLLDSKGLLVVLYLGTSTGSKSCHFGAKGLEVTFRNAYYDRI